MHCNLIQKRQIENFSHPRLIFKITLHKTFSISVIAKTNANQCAAQKKEQRVRHCCCFQKLFHTQWVTGYHRPHLQRKTRRKKIFLGVQIFGTRLKVHQIVHLGTILRKRESLRHMGLGKQCKKLITYLRTVVFVRKSKWVVAQMGMPRIMFGTWLKEVPI